MSAPVTRPGSPSIRLLAVRRGQHPLIAERLHLRRIASQRHPERLDDRRRAGSEVSITVPYGHAGDAARSVMDKVHRLGVVVADATGRPGYDPQLDLPLTEARATNSAWHERQ